jgi:hypothetical protein
MSRSNDLFAMRDYANKARDEVNRRQSAAAAFPAYESALSLLENRHNDAARIRSSIG